MKEADVRKQMLALHEGAMQRLRELRNEQRGLLQTAVGRVDEEALRRARQSVEEFP